jgi:hypothetical protein
MNLNAGDIANIIQGGALAQTPTLQVRGLWLPLVLCCCPHLPP